MDLFKSPDVHLSDSRGGAAVRGGSFASEYQNTVLELTESERQYSETIESLVHAANILKNTRKLDEKVVDTLFPPVLKQISQLSSSFLQSLEERIHGSHLGAGGGALFYIGDICRFMFANHGPSYSQRPRFSRISHEPFQ